MRITSNIYSNLLEILTVSLIFLASCEKGSRYRFEEGIAWNTAYHITYESESSLSDSIINILSEIDNSLSPFNSESTVSKINDNRSTQTDGHFINVFQESVKVNKLTEGAFDPTLGPLIRAWGFGKGHEISPSDTLRLDSLLQLVGISKTEIVNEKLIKSDPRIEFNFSALAKGYGVDCISEMLERNGVENYLIEIGGEIRAKGKNSKGSAWGIGIDRPEENSRLGEIMEELYLQSGAVATSGNYRNFQQTGSEKFGHTISPSSGRPIKTDVLSATVVAPTCMMADALATSCMVLGSEDAFELCNRLKVGLMLVKSDMSVVSNEIFKTYSDISN